APEIGDARELTWMPEGHVVPELARGGVEHRFGAIPDADETDPRTRGLPLLRADGGGAEKEREEQREGTAAHHTKSVRGCRPRHRCSARRVPAVNTPRGTSR